MIACLLAQHMQFDRLFDIQSTVGHAGQGTVSFVLSTGFCQRGVTNLCKHPAGNSEGTPDASAAVAVLKELQAAILTTDVEFEHRLGLSGMQQVILTAPAGVCSCRDQIQGLRAADVGGNGVVQSVTSWLNQLDIFVSNVLKELRRLAQVCAPSEQTNRLVRQLLIDASRHLQCVESVCAAGDQARFEELPLSLGALRSSEGLLRSATDRSVPLRCQGSSQTKRLITSSRQRYSKYWARTVSLG